MIKNITAAFGALAAATMTLTGSANAQDAEVVRIEASAEAGQSPITVASVDTSPQQVNFATAAEGKPVQFIYGSGVNSFNLQRVVESIEEAGCPVTTMETGNSTFVVARTNGDGISTKDVVFAGQWSLENCLD